MVNACWHAMLCSDSMLLLRRTVMKMERILIQVPKRLKAKLDALRQRGTSAAGLIRHLLEHYFKARKGA
jgi:hypothetical protein